MAVPRQSIESPPERAAPKGAAARTRALMIKTASTMLRSGLSPSVSDVAEAAGVSRSTAYRYFPTQADMLRAVVAEALGPILRWQENDVGSEALLTSFYRTAFPRLFEHEATFRAALRQSLEINAAEANLGRGHRRDLLARTVAGSGLPAERMQRLVQALSLTFGVEAMIVLKDIWGLSNKEAEEVALWAARALLTAARLEGTEKI
jgi:AcrR family transcriptional regulator